VPSETFTLTALGVTTTLHADLTGAPEVEVGYDGCSPPLELFGHLRVLGFVGLVPQPPPSAAIDWSRPDPAGVATGFSVRPYAATSRGRLDVDRDDRGRAIDATRFVLQRLATPATSRGAEDPSIPAPDDTRRAGRAAAIGDAPVHPPLDAGPLPPPPAPPVVVPPDRRLLIEVTVAVEHTAATRPVLAAVGDLVGEAPAVWTTTAVYRGQAMETRHHGTGFVVEIAPADRDALLATVGAIPVHALRELSTIGD
jgi:hypothetical protein